MSVRHVFLANKETLMNVRAEMELTKPKQNGHCLQAALTMPVEVNENTHQINSHTQTVLQSILYY